MMNTNLDNDQNLILVVDDDQSIRMTIRFALEREGYRILEAENGEQCLEICQQQVPNLILLDAVMPNLDGFSCCTQLKKMFGYHCPPTLMMTVLDDRESVYQSFEVGITDYLLKPIDWAVLSQQVKRLLKTQNQTVGLKRKLGELHRLKEQIEWTASQNENGFKPY